ncbi:hypothetical protein [Variovorax saccharolyticus]|uniref:hypothetical protein n=1 Tax=Variovorax saccharolyticus TaxID=3053516 RepID=UPI002574FA12|nr:hypothetical protein [Variovorax sp. J31P216]MDM0025796.1 hypothetical protein [Variovorax sp. J31P216]
MVRLRGAAAALACVAAVFLVGCAQVKVAPPTASIDNVQKVKASGMDAAAVGEFKLAPGRSASLDQRVSIRSNTFYSPFDSSFAKYLGETLREDLRAAGLLEPGSRTTISGELTDSMVDASIGQGKGALAARFIVQKEGRTSFDKELKVGSSWDSSFVGAVAIPAAINQYMALYRALVAQLLDDPDFRKAVAR